MCLLYFYFKFEEIYTHGKNIRKIKTKQKTIIIIKLTCNALYWFGDKLV